jgi:hypothetical protein
MPVRITKACQVVLHPGSGPRASPQAGTLLTEVAIAAAVLAIALAGLLSVIVSANSLRNTNREMALANQAARAQLELMQSEVFRDIFNQFGPLGPRNGFAVRGLEPQSADADGLVGRIVFPTDATGAQLREDVVDADLGMPRDLNGDLVPDALDHRGDYTLLPVRVLLEWSGENGDRQLQVETLLVAR